MPNPQVQSIEVDIKTWDELHSWILGALKTWWLFRGQAEYRWNLSPKIARNYNKLRSPTLVPIAFKSSLLGIFKRQVRTILDIVPDDSDILGWLALMQHYGAPTRLLDWTYSPYIALYFAIESLDETKDAAIWAMDATICAATHIGVIEVKAWDQFALLPIVDPARRSFQHVQNERIRNAIDTNSRWPLPLIPEWTDIRMAAQQSVFTLSGDVLFPIDRLKSKRNWQIKNINPPVANVNTFRTKMNRFEGKDVLCKVRVPASVKREALQFLAKVGITPATLFPGLQGLGRTVDQEHFKHLGLADNLTGIEQGFAMWNRGANKP